MKFAEYSGGINIYTADLGNFTVYRSNSDSPFTDELVQAYSITLEHPEIPKRAWLTLPCDVDEPHFIAETVYQEFKVLWEKGETFQKIGETLKQKYFTQKDFGELFEQNSNYQFPVQLKR